MFAEGSAGAMNNFNDSDLLQELESLSLQENEADLARIAAEL